MEKFPENPWVRQLEDDLKNEDDEGLAPASMVKSSVLQPKRRFTISCLTPAFASTKPTSQLLSSPRR